jgi:hypothetical protein
MTQDHATPVTRRTLAVVRAGTEGGPAAVPPVPADGTGSCPDAGAGTVPVPAAVPMTVPERAVVAGKRASTATLKVVRELWLLPDRFLHVIIHGRAETMAEHRAHIKSRDWVPPEMTGAAEKAVIGAGLFHHLVIARPLKASMKAVKFAAEKVDQAADRPLRLYLTVILAVALIVLLARYL